MVFVSYSFESDSNKTRITFTNPSNCPVYVSNINLDLNNSVSTLVPAIVQHEELNVMLLVYIFIIIFATIVIVFAILIITMKYKYSRKTKQTSTFKVNIQKSYESPPDKEFEIISTYSYSIPDILRRTEEIERFGLNRTFHVGGFLKYEDVNVRYSV